MAKSKEFDKMMRELDRLKTEYDAYPEDRKIRLYYAALAEYNMGYGPKPQKPKMLAVYEELQDLTGPELFKLAVKAGIYTATGERTDNYKTPDLKEILAYKEFSI